VEFESALGPHVWVLVRVIHKKGLCLSSGGIHRLMMMMNYLYPFGAIQPMLRKLNVTSVKRVTAKW
jgi:hypothetical protein